MIKIGNGIMDGQPKTNKWFLMRLLHTFEKKTRIAIQNWIPREVRGSGIKDRWVFELHQQKIDKVVKKV